MDMLVPAKNAFRRPAALSLLMVFAAAVAMQLIAAPSAVVASFKASVSTAAAERIAAERIVAEKTARTADDETDSTAAATQAAPTSASTQKQNSAPSAKPASSGVTKLLPSAAEPAAVVAKPAARVTEPSAPAAESAPCQPQCKPCPPRTQDEVWLVSSRCLGCPDVEGTPYDFGVMQFDLKAHQWNSSTLKAFLADQDASKTDVVWVHGYRIDSEEAQEQGLGVYEQLTSCAPSDRPIRLIVYSWAATPCAGIIEDTRMKAARTNSEGYYLAWLVNRIDRRVTVNMIGYSFGARIVTGALQVLAGGSLMGRTLPEPVEHRAPMQAIIIASAVNNDWLAMGRPHGLALNVVDRMLALNNGCDRALKHYAVVDPCTKPEALGYTGAMGPLGDNGRKLYEIDLCCTVGKQHNWKGYFYTPSVVARMRPYVGLAP